MKQLKMIFVLMLSVFLVGCGAEEAVEEAIETLQPTMQATEAEPTPTEVEETPEVEPTAGEETATEEVATVEPTATLAAPETVAPTIEATLLPPLDESLQTAFDNQIIVNEILTNPELGTDVTAIRLAVAEATPPALLVVGSLEVALPQASGETADFINAALAELNSAVLLGEQIATGDDDVVLWSHEELVIHGAAALGSINLALASIDAGPSAPEAGTLFSDADLELPEGYQAEIVANELNFLSAIAIASDGTVYVAEAGYSYGNIQTPARVLRVGADGQTEVAAEGFEGPLVGIAVNENQLFVSHRNTISVVDLDTGTSTDIITELPSIGDHFNENIAVGPDGLIYFTQGVATNSGVVGLDNYFFGWLPMAPDFHDIPCRDLTLNGTNYTTGNILTEDVSDTTTTGPYLPFGTPAEPGQVVTGEVKCSGAVLRANPDGTGLEVFADGFRNPYGLAFHPDGRLFVTENGPDVRGSRPVLGPDVFYEVIQGGWYGWPDFYGGVPVNDPSRTPHDGQPSEPVLQDPPPLAAQPTADLGEHTVSNGFDFSRSETFAPLNQAYVAQFGDLTPVTSGGVEEQYGQMVVVVTEEGEVLPFLTSTAAANGAPLFRPTDAKFDASGEVLYVVHFGEINAVPGGIAPVPGTGALIRITGS